MALPRIRMDFNGYSLHSTATQEDIKRQGLQLYPGMRAVFYDYDAEKKGDGWADGLLHSAGEIWWDAKSERFMLDMRTVEFQFTPGTGLSVLDDLYPGESAQMPGSLGNRVELALQASQPFVALYDLASTLKAEGMGQVEMYHLYGDYFQRTEFDEPLHDALSDVLDTIWGGGWAKGRALFESELKSDDVT